MILAPEPKIVERGEGSFKIKGGYAYIGEGARNLRKFVKDILKLELSAAEGKNTVARFYVDPNQIPRKEGYRLFIDERGITVIGGDEAGLYYGIQTLGQIIDQFGYTLPELRIEDWPDFHERGVMIDISRDKIPKMDTLKMIVDTLSRFKVNHLELYMEHTFAYRDHETVWRDYSPLTGEEIMELDEYARERFVELVPNQNSFGHMAKWLVHDEYKHMAEAPDGFITPWGDRWNIPFSLSPAVPETLDFLDSLYAELLPHFTSDKFNVGCDETFDLCQGKSKTLCEKIGKGRVYLEFLLKIHSLVRKYGKTMLFWGDIIKNHPELIGELPDGMVALIWGYEEDHPFEEECEVFAKSGVPFYVCPGTSTWNSILGRFDNAIKNIESAVRSGKKWGAIGVLNTDWGDNGHWQHLIFSFPGWIWGASLSWNSEGKIDLEKTLNVLVFKDRSGKIGGVLKKLGNVYKEFGIKTFNSSLIALPLIWPERVSKKHEYFKGLNVETLKNVEKIIEEALSDLKESEIERSDGDLLIREVENAGRLALHSVHLMRELIETEDGKITSIPKDIRKKLAEDLKRLVEDYKSLWIERNREGGLRFSVEKLMKVVKLYEE